MRPFQHLLLLAGLAFGCAPEPDALAAEPQASNLAQAVAATTSARWLSYEIEARPDLGLVCCLEGLRATTCKLDSGQQGWSTSRDDDPSVEAKVRVLLLVENGRVERVRAYSSDCPLEFKKPVTTLEVDAKTSLGYLAGLARGQRDEDLVHQIHAAIGQHADPEAGRLLVELANPREKVESRRSAIFWLGQTRGEFAVVALRKLLESEPSSEVREHIVFSLSQTHTPDYQGTTELIRLVKESPDRQIRRQALFWLGQSDDPRALDLITEVLR